MTKPEHLYRGTTRGWLGNPCCQAERFTCTSRDPIVATIFAVHCRNHGGSAVLHIFRVAEDWTFGSPNRFAQLELEEVVGFTPAELERKAWRTLDVDRALAILKGMGILLPSRLPGDAVRLTQYLTHESRRMTDAERAQFNSLAD